MWLGEEDGEQKEKVGILGGVNILGTEFNLKSS